MIVLLVLSQYGFACKYGIIGCKTAFSNTWFNNIKPGKAVIET